MLDNNNVIEIWNLWGRIGSFSLIGIGVAIMLFHLIKLLSIKSLKGKYDYINKNEINLLWISSLFIIIGGAINATTYYEEAGMLWFFVRAFVSCMVALIIGVIVSNILKFYYPFFVEKRLKKLRYTPRVSPNTGKPMKLLSEEEEDVYLDEGMQAEENCFSVDYDVWVDEESGYTQIEKYAGHLHALQCPECNYQTLKVVKEEIIDSPTTTEEGELMKFYKCTYCNHKTKKTFKIAKLKEATLSETSTVIS
jgi:DNA-directed RNA polymerase subunit RPC12/RpoP